MPTIYVHVDDQTYGTLLEAAKELDRTVSDLADSAVSEAALDYARHKRRPSERVEQFERNELGGKTLNEFLAGEAVHSPKGQD